MYDCERGKLLADYNFPFPLSYTLTLYITYEIVCTICQRISNIQLPNSFHDVQRSSEAARGGLNVRRDDLLPTPD